MENVDPLLHFQYNCQNNEISHSYLTFSCLFHSKSLPKSREIKEFILLFKSKVLFSIAFH